MTEIGSLVVTSYKTLIREVPDSIPRATYHGEGVLCGPPSPPGECWLR